MQFFFHNINVISLIKNLKFIRVKKQKRSIYIMIDLLTTRVVYVIFNLTIYIENLMMMLQLNRQYDSNFFVDTIITIIC